MRIVPPLSLCAAVFGIVLGFVPASGATRADPGAGALRLVAATREGALDRFAIRDGAVVGLRDGAAVALPSEVDWRLEGDLAAHAELVHLSPHLFISREKRVPQRNAGRPLRYDALVSLAYTAGQVQPPWDDRTVEGGIVVFGWLLDRACVQVLVVATTNARQDERRVARAHFQLPESQARGLPFVLLLKNNAFVPPRPWFTHAAANRALAAFHFEPAEQAASHLARFDVKSTLGIHQVRLLHILAEGGLDEAVRRTLQAGAPPNAVNQHNLTALDWAATNGRTGVVEILLAAGAKPDGVEHVDTPLINAIHGRHDAVGAALVRGGADFRRQAAGDTVAWRALRVGLTETVRAIAARGGYKDRQGDRDALLLAAVRAGDATLAALLLECGASPRQKVAQSSLMTLAVQSGSPELIAALLAAGGDGRQPDSEGVTPLAEAVRGGNLQIVEALLAAGAPPNTRARSGETPLLAAVARGDTEILAKLLGAGARVDFADPHGAMALRLALAVQSPPLIAAILKAGAEPNAREENLPELIAGAIVADVDELLPRAVGRGWDPRRPLAPGVTALDLARVMDSPRCVRWLETRLGNEAGPSALLAPVDAAPQPTATPSPVDVRTRSRAYPAEEVRIRGIVAADGRLLFPRVQTAHFGLRRATIEALRGWKFAPATRAGRPVAVAVSFPLNFRAIDRAIYELSEVDRRPVVLKQGSALEAVREIMERGEGFYVGNARVTFVVEKDGTVSEVVIPADVEATLGPVLRRMLPDYRFAPAQRAGQTVRVWVDTDLGYDVRAGPSPFPAITTGNNPTPPSNF